MLQIGNPLLEFNTDFNSRAEFFWSHGLISDSSYESATLVCNYSTYRRQIQIIGSVSPACYGVWRQAFKEVSKFVDLYDVTLDVCLTSVSAQSLMLNHLVRLLFTFICIQNFHYSALKHWEVYRLVTNSDFISFSARNSKDWCVCGRSNNQLLKQKRCAEGFSCWASWSNWMDSLQQVTV